MNKNSITDFKRRYNKNKVTLYCRKCYPDLLCQNENKLNPDELPMLIITDGNLWKKKSWKPYNRGKRNLKDTGVLLCIRVLLLNKFTKILKYFTLRALKFMLYR